MTVQIASRPESPATGALEVFRLEAIETLRIAMPMATAQLAQVAMFTTDLTLIGRLGSQAIAAAALAHVVFFSVFSVGFGIVGAVCPLAAQNFGAGLPDGVRRASRAGLWAAFAIGVPSTVLLQWGGEFLCRLGQEPEIARDAGQYLAGLTFSLIPVWAALVRECLLYRGCVADRDGRSVTRSQRRARAIPLCVRELLAYRLFNELWAGVRFRLGPLGIWLGLTTGLAVYGLLLFLRFLFVVRGRCLEAAFA